MEPNYTRWVWESGDLLVEVTGPYIYPGAAYMARVLDMVEGTEWTAARIVAGRYETKWADHFVAGWLATAVGEAITRRRQPPAHTTSLRGPRKTSFQEVERPFREALGPAFWSSLEGVEGYLDLHGSLGELRVYIGDRHNRQVVVVLRLRDPRDIPWVQLVARSSELLVPDVRAMVSDEYLEFQKKP